MSERSGGYRIKYWNNHHRESYTCPDCGRSKDQLSNGFEVHHIDGDPTNNQLKNLVGLCTVCHKLREGKKPTMASIREFRRQFNSNNPDKANICSSLAERENLLSDANTENVPCVFIEQIEGQELASIVLTSAHVSHPETDNLNLSYTTDCREKIKSILHVCAGKSDTNLTVPVEARPEFSVGPIKTADAIDVAERVSELVLNEDNWLWSSSKG